MNYSVLFRDFEERDVDFVFKTKNNKTFFDLSVSEQNSFTYEDAIAWVQGCKKNDDSFKFWAICTDDEEKRIIGWCGIANIDYHNKSAYFHTIVISDKQYMGGIVVYATHKFIMHYVFEELKFNRLYSSYLSENTLQHRITQLIFNCVEGVMKEAIYKNGTFHDLTIAAILKKEYFEHKKNGDFESESVIQKLMPENSGISSNENVSDFLDFVASSLEETPRSELSPDTRFRDLPEWSSLTALLMISGINEKYKVALNEDELVSSETFEDVFNAIKEKL